MILSYLFIFFFVRGLWAKGYKKEREKKKEKLTKVPSALVSKEQSQKSKIDEVSWDLLLKNFEFKLQVRGNTETDIELQFISERDEKLRILVTSYIKEMDRIGTKVE